MTTIHAGWLGLEKGKGLYEKLYFVLAVNAQHEPVMLFGQSPEHLRVNIHLKVCSLRDPKKKRKGHEHAFRLNMNAGPHVGKLILDPGTAEERRAWLTALSNPMQTLDTVLRRRQQQQQQLQQQQQQLEQQQHQRQSGSGARLSTPSSVSDWLESNGMAQYITDFDDAGYDDLDTIADMAETDLLDAGVSKPGHVKRMVKNIQDLRREMGLPELPHKVVDSTVVVDAEANDADVDAQLAQYGVRMVGVSGGADSSGGGGQSKPSPHRQRRASAEDELDAIAASSADMRSLLPAAAASAGVTGAADEGGKRTRRGSAEDEINALTIDSDAQAMLAQSASMAQFGPTLASFPDTDDTDENEDDHPTPESRPRKESQSFHDLPDLAGLSIETAAAPAADMAPASSVGPQLQLHVFVGDAKQCDCAVAAPLSGPSRGV
jgi:hypothetical protein